MYTFILAANFNLDLFLQKFETRKNDGPLRNEYSSKNTNFLKANYSLSSKVSFYMKNVTWTGIDNLKSKQAK